jgi:hypothetical protein
MLCHLFLKKLIIPIKSTAVIVSKQEKKRKRNDNNKHNNDNCIYCKYNTFLVGLKALYSPKQSELLQDFYQL